MTTTPTCSAGAARVLGMSSQTPDYQAEVVERLHLPFVMLSDARFALADALGLPTFAARGRPGRRRGQRKRTPAPLYPPDTRDQRRLYRTRLLSDFPSEHPRPANTRLANGSPHVLNDQTNERAFGPRTWSPASAASCPRWSIARADVAPLRARQEVVVMSRAAARSS